jgi:PKD repeat protein
LRKRSTVQVAVLGLLIGLVAAAAPAEGAAEPGVVHFTAVGDYGATADTSAVLGGIAAQNPDLNLALGDLSYGGAGSEQAWCDFVTARVGAGFPFELLTGNHESSGQDGNINDFAACLPNQLPGVVGTYGRQWFVDVPRGNPLVRFMMISPGVPFSDGIWSYAPGTARYNWTAAAIDGARAANIPWVVVGMHKPCLSTGEYGCEAGTDITNLLVSKKVDLVLTGHEHIYQRTKQLALAGSCTAITPGTYTAACVTDADNDLRAGAGTVFATVGTGGAEQYPVNMADSEANYFAALSGENLNPAAGLLDVRATATDLTARFVPVGGAAFTDTFAIRRGTPPPNQSPTAAFASTTSGLGASVNGTGSTDPDGAIASYAWAFGDGGTATGATAQHSYAAAGTYQVTLTVIDNSGAKSAVTHPVTVTAAPPPPGPADFMTDTFNRTVSGGLGTADLGGAWTTVGTAANFSVAPGSGAFTLAAPATQLSAYLSAVTRTDTDLRLTVTPDKVTTGNGIYLDVAGRRVGNGSEYEANLILQTGGRVLLGLTALRSGVETTMVPPAQLTGVGYAAGTGLNIRLQVTGTSPTTVRAKVWAAGSAEPSTWQATATDSTAALQAAGGVGVTAYLSSSATNAPVTVRLSGLSARPTA